MVELPYLLNMDHLLYHLFWARELDRQLCIHGLHVVKSSVATRISALSRGTTNGTRYVMCIRRPPKLLLMELRKDFASSVAGSTCWRNLMMVSVVVVGVLLPIISVEGSPS
uniref:Uncharacterized protein n=1 Tax=Opuntia streptacantha TaxID=393608 RepID=A0A7C9AC44_OPUST